MLRKLPLLAACALMAGCSPTAQDAAQASEGGDRVFSILNAGIRAEFGEAKFLFDPLYDNHFGSLAEMGPELVERIIAGQPPYDGVDAIFVSHAHGDHFSAEYLNRLMAAQPAVTLVAPGQAVDAMRAQPIWQDAFSGRIIAINLENGEAAQSFTLAGAQISAFRTPHAGWPDRHGDTHNITYRLSAQSGVRIMHLGDADPVAEHFAPNAQLLQSGRSDVAFVPFWFFTAADPDALIDDSLNADAAVGIHVPAKPPKALEQSGREFFTREGQVRIIDPQGE